MWLAHLIAIKEVCMGSLRTVEGKCFPMVRQTLPARIIAPPWPSTRVFVVFKNSKSHLTRTAGLDSFDCI